MVAHSRLVGRAVALDHHRRRRSTACRGCRPASCRSRTRAICWRPCSCPTALRWSAPSDVSTQVTEIAGKAPGVEQVDHHCRHLRARQQRDARQCRRRLSDARRTGARAARARICCRCSSALQREARRRSTEARMLVLPPPPIQGIGNAGGFTMQVAAARRQLRLPASCRPIANAIVGNAQTQSGLQRVQTPVPRRRAAVRRRCRPRQGARRCMSRSTQVFSTLSSYLGSTYVNQFNKFGRTFQVYVQADSQLPPDAPTTSASCTVRNQQGDMIPLGTLVTHHADGRPVADHPLQSLSRPRPSSACRRAASAPGRR